MVSVVACLVGALVLLAAACLKLADGNGSRAALGTYGLRGETAARAWAALIAVELALAVGVGAGVDGAAWGAAALMTVFAIAQAAALVSGRGGAPCACFGARGSLSRATLGRSVLLAAGFAVLPLLPREPMSTDAWLGVGLGAALLGLAALAVVVLSLAREVGALRMQLVPQGALEIPQEGPELGGRTALGDEYPDLGARLGLAVFTSEGCGMCRALKPSIAAFGRDPFVVLRTFDEQVDAAIWADADVPAAPTPSSSTARARCSPRGRSSSAAQLESVLAAAERRREAVGG